MTVVGGPLTSGWPKAAPYDVILLEGATEVAPQAFLRQLKDGGRLVCILGGGPGAKAIRYYRSGEELGGASDFRRQCGRFAGLCQGPGVRLLIAVCPKRCGNTTSSRQFGREKPSGGFNPGPTGLCFAVP